MKKRICLWLLCQSLLLPLVTTVAYADCAPKPSIHVKTESEVPVYVAILSPYEQYGPNHAVKPKTESGENTAEKAWNAFCNADYGGLPYYFCGHYGLNGASWTYICPEQFRVAIYCPEYDTVIFSQKVYSCYSFRSDFKLDLSDVDLTTSGAAELKLRQDVEYGKLIGGFLLRATLTLLIELAVAFLFGYWDKKYIRIILFVNLVTQVGLNALLSLWYFANGPMTALLSLVLAEMFVLAAESIFYVRRLTGERRGAVRAVLYAITANLASVSIGWYLID